MLAAMLPRAERERRVSENDAVFDRSAASMTFSYRSGREGESFELRASF